jgi:nanoRNase/pAp phosphatase (c-di-AMP/oligoRNAs hydrolase)
MFIFTFNNPSTFQYYTLFLVIYGLSLILAIALKMYKKKKKLKMKQLNLTLRTVYFWLATYSIVGFFLLFSRYAVVYFLSMPFLHILNYLVAFTFIMVRLVKFKKANS